MTSATSAQTLQIAPDRRPAPGRARADLDRLAVLVVVDSRGVVDARGQAAVPEVAEVPGAEADRDHPSRAVRGRAPVAERVVAAVGAWQPEARAVSVDGPGLAVVRGEDHGAGTRAA